MSIAHKEEWPLKRVVNTRRTTNRYCRPGEGSIVHTLECGHEVRTKQSAGYTKRKRCADCHCAALQAAQENI